MFMTWYQIVNVAVQVQTAGIDINGCRPASCALPTAAECMQMTVCIHCCRACRVVPLNLSLLRLSRACKQFKQHQLSSPSCWRSKGSSSISILQSCRLTDLNRTSAEAKRYMSFASRRHACWLINLIESEPCYRSRVHSLDSKYCQSFWQRWSWWMECCHYIVVDAGKCKAGAGNKE